MYRILLLSTASRYRCYAGLWCRSFFRSLCCFSCCDSSETQEPRNVLMGAYLSQPVTDKVVLTSDVGLQKADMFSKTAPLKGHATGNVMRTCNEFAAGGRRRRECRFQVWRLCNAGLANRNGKYMLLLVQTHLCPPKQGCPALSVTCTHLQSLLICTCARSVVDTSV